MPAGVTGASAGGADPSGHLPLLWTDAVPRKLPLAAPSMELTSANAHGVVAGVASGSNREYAFRYENGRYTRLRIPPGLEGIYPYPPGTRPATSCATVHDITDDGTIVGGLMKDSAAQTP